MIPSLPERVHTAGFLAQCVLCLSLPHSGELIKHQPYSGGKINQQIKTQEGICTAECLWESRSVWALNGKGAFLFSVSARSLWLGSAWINKQPVRLEQASRAQLSFPSRIVPAQWKSIRPGFVLWRINESGIMELVCFFSLSQSL